MTAPRRRLSKQEHLAMFIAQEGKCNCGSCGGVKLQPGKIHEQHDPPYEIMKDQTGYDGKPNKLFTVDCHKRETKEKDGPMIKKARHMSGGRGSQRAKRKNKGYRPIKSRNTLSKEYRKQAAAYKKEKESDE